jgi:hypothetical protein
MDLILVTRLHGTRSHEAKVKILHEFAAKERSAKPTLHKLEANFSILLIKRLILGRPFRILNHLRSTRPSHEHMRTHILAMLDACTNVHARAAKNANWEN